MYPPVPGQMHRQDRVLLGVRVGLRHRLVRRPEEHLLQTNMEVAASVSSCEQSWQIRSSAE